jgi:hypothetical protein
MVGKAIGIHKHLCMKFLTDPFLPLQGQDGGEHLRFVGSVGQWVSRVGRVSRVSRDRRFLRVSRVFGWDAISIV